ncbi:MAG TPA: glycoside hydrolase family 9 protein [Polyangiaceae bacterium]|nr:glycoside hydrolase family 9 protein [Polyangiaceae bacterium]
MKLRKYGSTLIGLAALVMGCGAADADAPLDDSTSSPVASNSRNIKRPKLTPWKKAGTGGATGVGGSGGDSSGGSAGVGGSGGNSSGGSAGVGGSGGDSSGGSAGVGGSGGTAGSGPIPTPGFASVTSVSSTSATIAWNASGQTSATRVYIGSEPPASPGGPLADQRLVATLDGNASSHSLSDLAPATDLFVRIERDTSGGTVSDDVRVRTVGGPRAHLDSPVRSVHSFGPRVLMVVVANGSGSTWQSSGWSVTRADGKSIAVNAVRRHSIAVGAPSYTVGYGEDYSDSVIDVDHRIYLQLAEPLGNHDLFRVTGPNGLSMTVPFSDRYTETPIIQLNQVGYNPRATERWAYVSGWMGDGGPMSFDGMPGSAEVLRDPADDATARTVALASTAISARSSNDEWAGGQVRQIDLAQLPADEDARYRIRIPGVGVSWPTAVSEKAALKSFYTVARGMLYNRWGVELKMPSSQFLRPADHTTIFTAESTDWVADYTASTPQTGQRTLIGGYHDAGDFDQRPMHTVVAELLLRAFELHPASYSDGQLHLPESGNGIPDILDEALWGVAGWEQLQEADGGVRYGAQTYRHPWGFYHADKDPTPYWTYGRGANVSARAAGLFAQASRLVRPFAPARADTLAERAARAWTWASANGASAPFRLYAAGELFRLTGNAAYKSAFEQAWSQMGPSGAFSNFAGDQLYMGDYMGDGRAVPDYLLGYLGATGASSSIQSTSLTWLTNMANGVVSTLQTDHAHRHPAGAGRNQDWGNASTTGKYMDPVIARLQLGNLSAADQQRYFDALSLSADWVLGGNPNGYVYISGLGSRKVEEPLHLDSLAYVKEGQGVMPGIPVYGPIEGAPGASWTAATVGAFYPSFDSQPKGMRYADVRTMVTCNEFTIWETQAPHTALFAALMGPLVTPPASWQPGQSGHLSPLP